MESLEGKIFLNQFRGSCLINKEEDAFGDLYLFHDETLPAAGKISYTISTDTYLIVIPVTGDLVYTNEYMKSSVEVNVGQALIVHCSAFFDFSLKNPFTNSEINFLQIRLRSQLSVSVAAEEILNFDVSERPNRLVDLLPSREMYGSKYPFQLQIGQFSGRQEAVCPMNKSDAGIFCFVLAGAFEIQGRLLHPKDGLAIWNAEVLEMEALSDNALVLSISLLGSVF